VYGYVSEFIEWYILLCLEYPSLSYFDSTFGQGQGCIFELLHMNYPAKWYPENHCKNSDYGTE